MAKNHTIKLSLIAFLSGCAPYAEIGAGYHITQENTSGRVPCFLEVGLQDKNGASVALRHDSHCDTGDIGYKEGYDSSTNSIITKWRFE